MVLATRTSAYAAAVTLGWLELWVESPTSIDDIVSPIINAIGARDQKSNSWIEGRLSWALETGRRFPQLSETPLLAAALAVEAAESPSLTNQPSSAGIIEAVVDRVATNWEMRPGTNRADFPAGLHSLQISDALHASLRCTSWKLVTTDSAPRIEEIVSVLSEGFVRRHGLSPGVAGTLATTALHFWDEAGILVFDRNKTIEARSRVVIEVAAARHLTTFEADRRSDGIRLLASDSTTHSILSFAIAMSQTVAGEILHIVLASGDRALLSAAATGVQECSQVSDSQVRSLVVALSSLPTTVQNEKAELVRQIVSISNYMAEKETIEDIVSQLLPADAASVWLAIAHLLWNAPAAKEEAVATILKGRPRLAGVKAGGFLPHAGATSAAFDQLIVETIRQLDPNEKELAKTLLYRAYETCSVGAWRRVARAAESRGFEVSPSDIGRTRSQWETLVTDPYLTGDSSLRSFLAMLQQESAPTLSVRLRRALPLLRTLVGTLELGEAVPAEFSQSLIRHGEKFRAALTIYVQLCRLDPLQLAAEAEALNAEMTGDGGGLYLFAAPNATELSGWDHVDAGLTISAAADLLGQSPLLAYWGAKVLVAVPDTHKQVAAHAVTFQLSLSPPPRQRRLAALVALELDQDTYEEEWKTSTDSILRSAVIEGSDGRPNRLSIIASGLSDRDALVREYASGRVTKEDVLNPLIAKALTDALSLPDRGTCQYCGQEFSEQLLNCVGCNCALPKPNEKIRKLLDTGLPCQ